MGEVWKALAKLEKKSKKATRISGAVCLMLVLFSVIWFVRPAVATTAAATCGLEEHSHTESCYEDAEQTIMICALEEHAHVESCYPAVVQDISGSELQVEVMGYTLNTLLKATDTISWSLKVDQSGGYIVRLEGSGAIPDNFFAENEDLQNVKSIIRKLEVSEGITSIGTSAFQDFTYLEEVTFDEGSQLEYIGGAAFSGCTNLEKINLEVTQLKTIEFLDSSRHYPSGGAFHDTGLKEVSLPATLEYLGGSAFYSCEELEEVHFAENCNLQYLGAFAFRYNSAMRLVGFENCTHPAIILGKHPSVDPLYGSHYSVLGNCAALEELTIPSGFSGSMHAFAVNCFSLKKVTVQPNSQITDLTDAFEGCTGLEEIDLSPLTMAEDGGESLTATFLGATALKKVTMPTQYSKNIGPQTFSGCSALGWENIDFGQMQTKIETIGAETFTGIDVKEVDLSGWTALSTIGTSAFANCAELQKLILPRKLTTINEKAFQNNYALSEIVLRASELSSLGTGVFDGVPMNSKLTIGTEVETLSGNFLAALAGHCGMILFEGPQELSITEYPGGNGLAEPFANMSGKFYVDENGVLYQLKAGSAAVVYCPPGLSACTIPSEITAGSTYPVTEVSSNAFCQAKQLSALTFAAPEEIALAASAFAECKTLAAINTQTTVAGAKALFLDAEAPKAFYNTGLGGSTITLPGDGVKTNANITLENTDTTTLTTTIIAPAKYESIKDSVYRYLTGNAAEINVSVNLATVADASKKIRVYLAVDKEECEFGYVPGQEYTVDGVGCRLQRTDKEGIYYFEVDVPSSDKTVTIPIICQYPSPHSSGGKVQAWGQILTEAEVLALGNGVVERQAETSYYELEWYTEPASFNITKEAQAGAEVYMDADSKLWLRNLSYQISVSRVGTVNEKVGQDLVQEAEFADELTLPAGVSWRSEVVQAIQTSTEGAANWRYSYANNIGAVYVSISGEEVLLCTLSGLDGVLEEMYPTVNAAGNVVVHWKVRNNSSTAEINIPQATLGYGTEVLKVNMAEAGAVTKLTVDNQASVLMHYTYSAGQGAQAAASVGIEVGKGSIAIEKALTKRARYWGEEMGYTIRVYNPSAFAYAGTDAEGRELKIAQVMDPLPTNTYLTVEEMERLLNEDNGDRTSGIYLQIRIEKALFYKSTAMKEVVTVDGSTTAVTSLQNTGAVPIYEGLDTYTSFLDTGVVIISWVDGKLTIETRYNTLTDKNDTYTIGEGEDFAALKEALNDIGFVRDNATQYILRWRFPEDEQTLAGGEELVYYIHAIAKDSFNMSSSTDHVDYRSFHMQEYYNTENKAYVHSVHTTDPGKNNRKAASNAVKADSIAREMVVNQKVSKNGETLGENFQIEDNDVLQYNLNFRHSGTGTYDLLPLVDRMTGTQILLAEYAANKNQTWVAEKSMTAENITTVETVGGPEITRQYYVLDQPGTYKGVWIAGFYADTVTVTALAGGGLETYIKWYFSDMPAAEYSRSIKYRTLISLDRTNMEEDKYSVTNRAWMNDQPGHRLHVAMIGKGSRLSFDKNIVSVKGSTPAEDVLIEDDYCGINSGQQTTYRLEIGNSGGNVVLTAEDYYDILPDAGGAFAWEKEDIEISYVREGEIKLPTGWDVQTVTITGEGGSSYEEQRICWDSPVEYTGEGKLYIYVTLNWPESDADNTWGKYVRANAGDILYNTLSVHGLQATVSHELIEPGKARLQKGVFRVITGAYNRNTSASDIRGTGDRFHYVNTTTRPYYVIYYVTLYNGGNTRLYLSNLQDKLPQGFTYHSLESSVENRPAASFSVNSLATEAANANYVSTDATGKDGKTYYPIALMDGNDAAVDWVNTRVSLRSKTATADGATMLEFKFGGEGVAGELLYDEARGMYYLNPGQGLRFGYTCCTGEAEYSEDVANNVIVMPYTDYLNAGEPSVDQENRSIPSTPVSGPLIENLPYNDGECYVLSNAEAAEYGFTGGMGSTLWLASNVKVTRGEIIPGMTKSVKATVESGSEKAYSGSVKPADVVRWELQASNNGDMPITDYTITDTMVSPYEFAGNVSFAIVDGKGSKGIYLENDGDYLFRILNRTEVDGVVTLELENMLGEKKSVTLGGEAVSFENDRFLLRVNVGDSTYSTTEWGGSYKVSFAKNDAGDEVLKLTFTDKRLSIPERSYVRVEVDTVNVSGTYKNGTYLNQAILTPNSQTYDAGLINQGNNVLDDIGANAGVRNSAFINVASGFSTRANKAVTQGEETASTELTKKWLVIDKDKSFTYTLKVNGPVDQAMGQIVIIDTLPQVGDHSAFDNTNGRNSAFRVDFAEEPNVVVKVNNTALATADYAISYSTGTDFSSDDAAWEGTDSDSDTWTDSVSADARSLRVTIKGTDKLPAGATIEISFAAVVADLSAGENVALPGEIAWNSFGYRYEAGTLYLSAAPLNVGIKIPEIPTLQKKLIKNNTAYQLPKEENFSFLIYEGEKITDLTTLTDEALIAEAVKSRKYTIVTLTVEQGKAESELWQMEKPQQYSYNETSGEWEALSTTWEWTQGNSYHVLELPMEGNIYRLDAFNGQSLQSYSFVYDRDTKVSVQATNEYILWNIVVQKTDAETENLLLQNAIFGLYSTVEPTAAEKTALQTQIDALALRVSPAWQLVYGSDAVTYYLTDVAATDASGALMWSGLEKDAYVVVELQAPDGYHIDNTPILAQRSKLEVQGENYVFGIKALNTTAYELPQTGAKGVAGIYVTGILLSLFAGFYFMGKRKKNEENQ